MPNSAAPCHPINCSTQLTQLPLLITLRRCLPGLYFIHALALFIYVRFGVLGGGRNVLLHKFRLSAPSRSRREVQCDQPFQVCRLLPLRAVSHCPSYVSFLLLYTLDHCSDCDRRDCCSALPLAMDSMCSMDGRSFGEEEQMLITSVDMWLLKPFLQSIDISPKRCRNIRDVVGNVGVCTCLHASRINDVCKPA